MRKDLSQIVFYGALWGFLEATIGHLLHFIPWTIAGSIMFPIASVILVNAYVKLESKMSLMYIAVVASLVKSVDFFLPALSIYKTINPIIAFFLEALLVVAVVRIVMKDTVKTNLLSMQVASISWRALFMGYMAVQFFLTGNLAPYIKDLGSITNFLIIEGVVSGLLATGLYYMVSFISKKEHISFKVRPAISISLFVIAAITTYLL
jgi:hypothetical protein